MCKTDVGEEYDEWKKRIALYTPSITVNKSHLLHGSVQEAMDTLDC